MMMMSGFTVTFADDDGYMMMMMPMPLLNCHAKGILLRLVGGSWRGCMDG